ncbi:hypothetical protein FBZ88_106165 [Nitrospirillum bahiense]|uniref:Uncharacterized protein n=2 Tax=Nitrospirillum amazonense TaxID=28077 RepID=A0A560G1J2_9PROT|nr:hypothetical protein FBZ88_106165 [Nitrospirillum amazonense]
MAGVSVIDKISGPTFETLERMTKFNVSLTLITVSLFLDIMLIQIFKKGVLSFEWEWGDGALSVSVVLIFVISYCIYSSIMVPGLRMVCDGVLFPVMFRLFHWDTGKWSNHQNYILLSELRNVALAEESAFKYNIWKEEDEKERKWNEDQNTIQNMSFSCFLLMVFDYFSGAESLMSKLGIIVHGYDIKAIFGDLVYISLVISVSPWAMSLCRYEGLRRIDYAPLARKDF